MVRFNFKFTTDDTQSVNDLKGVLDAVRNVNKSNVDWTIQSLARRNSAPVLFNVAKVYGGHGALELERG